MNKNIENKHFPEAAQNFDDKLFEIPIHVLMSIIIVVAMSLYAMLDCALQKFETTVNINLKMISKIKNSFVIFCLFLYLSCVIPLFWKRFEVNLNKSAREEKKNYLFRPKHFA